MQINQQQLVKDLTESLGKLIDSRAKTTETNLRAEFKSAIIASEERQSKHLESVKDELKKEIKELRTGVAKRIIQQDERIDNLEEAAGTSPSKH